MNRTGCARNDRDADAPAPMGRRGVLAAMVAGAAAAISPPAAASRAAPRGELRGTRYRETEHVKTFYRLNRYAGGSRC
jgi:hypothetical protein